MAVDAGEEDGISVDVRGDDVVEQDAEADSGVVPNPYPIADCDSLMDAACSMPWPSNLYLAPDESRATGYTLTFGETTLPANRHGKHIKPGPYKQMDGYDVGVPLVVMFANIDIASMASEAQLERSIEESAPIVWFEVTADGFKRIPYWVELDASEEDVAKKTLFVRPAVILEEATRYVVAFRNLKTTAGASIGASDGFRALREGNTVGDSILAQRQERFDEIFALLEAEGIERSSLTLAWDFVTASSDAMHGRMLKIRDEAFETVGASGPAMSVTGINEFATTEDGTNRPVDAQIAFELHGTIEVPHYMRPRPEFGETWEFFLDADGEIAQNGTRRASFMAHIPRSVLGGAKPAGLIIYGHGLLGSRQEVRAKHLSRIANDFNYIIVGSDLMGMSGIDNAAALSTVGDASNFVAMADRLHQGMLEYLLLTRAAREQFEGLEPISARGIVIDKTRVHYMGGSQGGIFGATYMALTQDVTRGYLGVPGNNYSTMLQRSTGFNRFIDVMVVNYKESIDRALLLSTISLLWSNTEPVSYLRHIKAEPFAGNGPRDVLMTVAKADYQVAVVTNEVLARTDLGIGLMENYDSERTPWDVIQTPYPHTGSGIVLYDFGNPWPPPGNQHPSDGFGDSHSKISRLEISGVQLDHFFRTGEIIDVCEGEPCRF
ncbi:MAG: hypothetical protein H0U74_00620 [Bradymonadaceae bacterium]|nr:hypothetical protein [Lujinxingiaceae bacterium]